ncbi:MAG TPA: hypothetical protein VNR90_06345 [Vicinamibacterales bacterium]|nr:hypothetical protein [Vicinamibacterales bacterium]
MRTAQKMMRTIGSAATALAAGLAIAGCGGDQTAGSSTTSGGGGSTGMAGVWTAVSPATLDATGGVAADPSGRGAPGGNVDVATIGALSFGAAFAAPVDAPAPPTDAQRITSLDADATVTGSAVIDGDVTVPGGGARRLTVMGGDLFVAGKVRSEGGAADRSLSLEAPNGTIYVTGTIDASATSGTAQNGGAISLTAARIVVTGTLTTEGGMGGGRAGDIHVSADVDVMLTGTVQGRGGAASVPSGDAQGGAAATLAIDAGGNVQLAGVVDLRGGLAHARAPGGTLAGGTGGHVAIGAARPPASVTFALDVSVGGGDGGAGAGAGGNLTLVVGGDFTVGGAVRSRGGSIAAGGSGDGGLAGNLTMDINTTAGNQIYRPGSAIVLDGGDSGGTGTAGGGGHFYGRSFDGIVTMSGTISARGGAARDAGGVGGLGGHVNIFSDNNFDGFGGDLTVTPEGVIDASGGAGTVGGSARNDGTTDVAEFPINQELIAVLLNADGIHGTPTNGVIDNQGVVIVRGGAGNGAGGDIAFHGEGTGGLHDPLGGRLEMNGDGTGPDGQFASE